jgi:hypothetical protein
MADDDEASEGQPGAKRIRTQDSDGECSLSCVIDGPAAACSVPSAGVSAVETTSEAAGSGLSDGRMPLLQACEGCHERKLRCSLTLQDTGPCERCIRHGRPCIRREEKKRGRPRAVNRGLYAHGMPADPSPWAYPAGMNPYMAPPAAYGGAHGAYPAMPHAMGYPAAHMPQPNMPPYPPQLPQLPQHTPWYMGLHESMQPVSMLPEPPLSDGNPAAAAAMAAQLAASAMGVPQPQPPHQLQQIPQLAQPQLPPAVQYAIPLHGGLPHAPMQHAPLQPPHPQAGLQGFVNPAPPQYHQANEAAYAAGFAAVHERMGQPSAGASSDSLYAQPFPPAPPSLNFNPPPPNLSPFGAGGQHQHSMPQMPPPQPPPQQPPPPMLHDLLASSQQMQSPPYQSIPQSPQSPPHHQQQPNKPPMQLSPGSSLRSRLEHSAAAAAAAQHYAAAAVAAAQAASHDAQQPPQPQQLAQYAPPPPQPQYASLQAPRPPSPQQQSLQSPPSGLQLQPPPGPQIPPPPDPALVAQQAIATPQENDDDAREEVARVMADTDAFCAGFSGQSDSPS